MQKCCWNKLVAANNSSHQLFVQIETGEDFFSLHVTDLVDVWYYSASSDESIQQDRIQYCPQLTMTTPNLIQYIERCLIGDLSNNEAKLQVQQLPQNNSLQILIDASMRMVDSGWKLPFHWELTCDPMTSSNNKKRKLTAEEVEQPSAKRMKQSSTEEDSSIFIREQIIRPMYSLVRNLHSQVEYLKRQLLHKDQIVNRFKEMYGSQRFDDSSSFDLVKFEENMISNAAPFQSIDISFSDNSGSGTLQRMFSKIYSEQQSSLLTVNSTSASLTTDDQSDSIVTTSSSSSSLTSNASNSQLSSTTLTTDDNGHDNTSGTTTTTIKEEEPCEPGLYIETEQEKQIRLALEQKLEAKKRKQAQNQLKKKLQKALM